jgi:hypothetical protein
MRPYTTLFAASALMAGSALARPDGTGAHHHHSEHSAVSAPSAGGSASGYGAPQSGYGAPDAGYGAPEQSYAQPDAGYGAPDPGYGAPSEGYADYSSGTGYVEPQDSYGVAASGDSGLSAILIPLLIAAALFLLIPGTRTVPVERKRRSADDAPSSNMIERVQDIYMSVLESEECIERIVCEIGGLAEDAGFSKKMTKSLEMFAPKKYAKMMKTFNHGKDCKKNNKCGYF